MAVKRPFEDIKINFQHLQEKIKSKHIEKGYNEYPLLDTELRKMTDNLFLLISSIEANYNLDEDNFGYKIYFYTDIYKRIDFFIENFFCKREKKKWEKLETKKKNKKGANK